MSNLQAFAPKAAIRAMRLPYKHCSAWGHGVGLNLGVPFGYSSPKPRAYEVGDIETEVKWEPSGLKSRTRAVVGLGSGFPTGSEERGTSEGVYEVARLVSPASVLGPVTIQGNLARSLAFSRSAEVRQDRWISGCALSATLSFSRWFGLLEVLSDFPEGDTRGHSPSSEHGVVLQLQFGLTRGVSDTNASSAAP